MFKKGAMMAKRFSWRDVFHYTEKPKKPVQIGDTYEDLTGTQAHRFEELTQIRKTGPTPTTSGLRKIRYTLAEASGCLNISEEQLLQQAASGSVDCFIDAKGLKGYWHRDKIDGQSIDNSANILTKGFLAITSSACKEMAQYGSINVSMLEYRCPSNTAAVSLDRSTLAALSAAGECEKFFRLQDVLWVDQTRVLLFAPLPDFAA